MASVAAGCDTASAAVLVAAVNKKVPEDLAVVLSGAAVGVVGAAAAVAGV